MLLYFLFQMSKQIMGKKLLNADFQTIADFLNGGDRCTVVSPADDIIQCGLGQSAHTAEFVDRYFSFVAQLKDP